MGPVDHSSHQNPDEAPVYSPTPVPDDAAIFYIDPPDQPIKTPRPRQPLVRKRLQEGRLGNDLINEDTEPNLNLVRRNAFVNPNNNYVVRRTNEAHQRTNVVDPKYNETNRVRQRHQDENNQYKYDVTEAHKMTDENENNISEERE